METFFSVSTVFGLTSFLVSWSTIGYRYPLLSHLPITLTIPAYCRISFLSHVFRVPFPILIYIIHPLLVWFHRDDDVCRDHGSRGGETEARRRQNPRLLLLTTFPIPSSATNVRNATTIYLTTDSGAKNVSRESYIINSVFYASLSFPFVIVLIQGWWGNRRRFTIPNSSAHFYLSSAPQASIFPSDI